MSEAEPLIQVDEPRALPAGGAPFAMLDVR